MFFTGCDEFTGVKEFNYPDSIVYRSTDSDIPDSREFAIAIDEWDERVCARGLERELIDSFEKFYIVI